MACGNSISGPGGSGGGGSGGAGQIASSSSSGMVTTSTGQTASTGQGGCSPDPCAQAAIGTPCGNDASCDGVGHCIVTLAEGRQFPGAIVDDGTTVFWVEWSTNDLMGGGLLANGKVSSCAVGGCGKQPTTIATGQSSPFAIDVDATSVLWANAGIDGLGTDGSVMRCDKSGCAAVPQPLASGIGPQGLAVDANHLFWTVTGNGAVSPGTVWSCDVPGCTPKKVASVPGLDGQLVARSNTVVWSAHLPSGGSLWRCAGAACVPQALVATPGLTVSGVAIDQTNVYFSDGDSLKKCALSGCGNQPVTLASGLSPTNIVTDGVYVYFTLNTMGGNASVMKCSVDGCQAGPTMLAGGAGIVTASGLAVDATGVYFTDATTGGVFKAPFLPPTTCGTSTSTSSTTSTGTGPTCQGGMGCLTATECPPTMSDSCTVPVCAAGCCGIDFVLNGTSLVSQTAGDCKTAICDGAGGLASLNDDTDKPVDADDCHSGACTSGVAGQSPKAGGTPCSSGAGKVCGDVGGPNAGKCVACNVATDCPTAAEACLAGTCFPATCFNQMKDGSETDIDCGGGACPACGIRKQCQVGNDCGTTVCSVGHQCVQAYCIDGLLDGPESDVDCGGGGCSLCGLGKQCNFFSDCASGPCYRETIAGPRTCHADFCHDNIHDDQETAVDCGGPVCAKCLSGATCLMGSDCQSGTCNLGVCL